MSCLNVNEQCGLAKALAPHCPYLGTYANKGSIILGQEDGKQCTNSKAPFQKQHTSFCSHFTVLEHKPRQNICSAISQQIKRSEIIQSVFDHNEINPQINNRKRAQKSPNIWTLKNTYLNNPWIKEKASRDIKKYTELNENENTMYQHLWVTMKAKKQIYSTKCNTLRKRKSNNLIVQLKYLEEEEQNKPNMSKKVYI